MYRLKSIGFSWNLLRTVVIRFMPSVLFYSCNKFCVFVRWILSSVDNSDVFRIVSGCGVACYGSFFVAVICVCCLLFSGWCIFPLL